jgi:Rieske Fe-S protein
MFVAYEQRCTHTGVLVNYDPATHHLVCPAHGAVFDPAQQGKVLQGPAIQPLAQVAVHIQTDGTMTFA